MLRLARKVVDGGILIDAQMPVDRRPSIIRRERAVVRVFALGVGGTNHLTVLHAAPANQHGHRLRPVFASVAEALGTLVPYPPGGH